MTPAMIVPHLPTVLLEDLESLSSRSEPEEGGGTVGFVAEAMSFAFKFWNRLLRIGPPECMGASLVTVRRTRVNVV